MVRPSTREIAAEIIIEYCIMLINLEMTVAACHFMCRVCWKIFNFVSLCVCVCVCPSISPSIYLVENKTRHQLDFSLKIKRVFSWETANKLVIQLVILSTRYVVFFRLSLANMLGCRVSQDVSEKSSTSWEILSTPLKNEVAPWWWLPCSKKNNHIYEIP